MMPMQSGTYNYPMNYSYSSMPQDPKSKPSTTTSNDPNDKNAMNHMNYNQYMYNYNYHYPYRATGSMKEEDKFSNRKPSFSENDSSMKRKDYNTYEYESNELMFSRSSYKSNSKYVCLLLRLVEIFSQRIIHLLITIQTLILTL